MNTIPLKRKYNTSLAECGRRKECSTKMMLVMK
jgi:hypothetical protein